VLTQVCHRVAGTWLCKQQTSCTTSAKRAQRGCVSPHEVLFGNSRHEAWRVWGYSSMGACAQGSGGEAARQSATGSLCGCVEPWGPSSAWCCYPVGAWCAPDVVFDEAPTRVSAGRCTACMQQLQGRLNQLLSPMRAATDAVCACAQRAADPDAVCAPSGSRRAPPARFRPACFRCGEHAAQLDVLRGVPAAAATRFATVTATTSSVPPMTLQRPPPDSVPQMDRAPRNIKARASPDAQRWRGGR
jgi:hypothetical protein